MGKKAHRKARTATKRERENADRWLQHAKSRPEITLDEALKPGMVAHAIFEHDDWCPALETFSIRDCKCSPNIKYHRE
ncbi:hypothetical protein [Bradyrhizobium sp. HKCCYLS20291]|uniref:hypothetical protein n=1 Tax=Bradyrhizobium sp. HKCCYLS20291 TaxID=3420766 RepID=UPI003EB9B6DF